MKVNTTLKTFLLTLTDFNEHIFMPLTYSILTLIMNFNYSNQAIFVRVTKKVI